MPRTHKNPSKSKLWLEFITIFAAFPIAIALMGPLYIYIILSVAGLFCARTLVFSHGYEVRKDWNWQAVTWKNMRPMLLRFAPCGLFLLAFVWVMIPERLLAFPLERPGRWLAVMLLYPIFSVAPQEFIFRSYIFTRYRRIFTERWQMLSMSALAFGWMHIFLLNWVAVLFSIVGGLIFSDTYARKKSLALATIEHALYGCVLFSLGMGYYFYHGNVR